MARARAILQSEYPYHIVARCINREWFNIPMVDVWSIFCEQLTQTSHRHDFQIHCFVLMSNHYHLIATTPRANISECMLDFSSKTSRRLTKAGNRINETFAGRHFKCILQTDGSFLNAYKYTYRNPVDAGACLRVEDYPFSSLRGVINPAEIRIPHLEDTTYLSDPQGILEWLNKNPDSLKLEAVRYGLKRPYFRPKKDRKTNASILGPNDVL